MKKIFIGVFLIFLLSAPKLIRAQGLGLELGGSVNGLFSTIAVNYSDFNGLKTGYSAGLFVKYNIANVLGVSLGVNYSQRGAKNVDPFLVYSSYSPLIDTRNKMNFIFNSVETPLLLHVYFADLGGLKLKALIGGTADFSQEALAVTYHDYQPYEYFNLPYKTVDDISNRIKGTSFGSLLGVGTEIDASPLVISANLVYEMGLKNMNNVVASPYFYNNYFGISLMISYKL